MSKPNILIVEDEGNVAEAIRQALINYDFNISSVVATGEEAIKSVQDKKTDLVLMDIVLASPMTGTEAARTIWTKFNIPIIFLTGFLNSHLLENAKLSDPFGYLLKPFNERELYSAIEMALYKSKMERSQKQIILLLDIARKINQVVNRTDDSQRLINEVIKIFTSNPEISAASLVLFDGLRNIYASATAGIEAETQKNILAIFNEKRQFLAPV